MLSCLKKVWVKNICPPITVDTVINYSQSTFSVLNRVQQKTALYFTQDYTCSVHLHKLLYLQTQNTFQIHSLFKTQRKHYPTFKTICLHIYFKKFTNIK